MNQNLGKEKGHKMVVVCMIGMVVVYMIGMVVFIPVKGHNSNNAY
jgi:hypothetical protein